MAASAKITERGADGIAVEALIPASQPGDVFPAGVVLDYVGASAPTGWLICDGSTVSRATYPNLRDVMLAGGSAVGVGDGSTTMVLPDCRQRVAVGKHSSGTFNTMGGTGGAETHSLTAAQNGAHSHGGATVGNTTTTDTQGDHLHGVFDATGGSRFAIDANTGSLGAKFWGTAGSTINIGAGITSTNGAHAHNVANHAHAINSDGSGSAHNNLQPYIVLNKIIRAY